MLPRSLSPPEKPLQRLIWALPNQAQQKSIVHASNLNKGLTRPISLNGTSAWQMKKRASCKLTGRLSWSNEYQEIRRALKKRTPRHTPNPPLYIYVRRIKRPGKIPRRF